MAVPVITSFSPATLPGNVGGQTTITGSSFTGTTGVTVNGVAGTFSVTNDTTLVVTIPNAIAGTATVAVTNGSGTTTDNTHLTVTTFNFPTRAAVVCLGGVFDTSNTTKFPNNQAGQYAAESPTVLGGTYPTSVYRLQERLAKILAVTNFNKRYPAQAISVPTL